MEKLQALWNLWILNDFMKLLGNKLQIFIILDLWALCVVFPLCCDICDYPTRCHCLCDIGVLALHLCGGYDVFVAFHLWGSYYVFVTIMMSLWHSVFVVAFVSLWRLVTSGVARKLVQWGHSKWMCDGERNLQKEGRFVDAVCLLRLGLWTNVLSFSLIQLVK